MMAQSRPPVGSRSNTIKLRNMSAILLILLRHKDISRAQIAKMTGLSATTVTNLVTELLEQGIVTQDDEDKLSPARKRRVGRPQVALRLVPEARYAIGIHIGISSVRVGVTDLLGRPLCVSSWPQPFEPPPETVLAGTASMVEEAIARCGIDPDKIVGVGVGASGLVDPSAGVNVFAPNLDWHNVPLREWYAERLNLPVTVDNNVRAMALGEALFGVGQDVYSLAFVYGRIGVGAGIVVNGQLYHGGGAGAGEIGHMTLVPDDGEACRCGNRGCLETLISEPVIVRLSQEIARQDEQSILSDYLREASESTTLERVFAAARAGDLLTISLLEKRARYLGIALANLVNILNPDLIVLGGIFAQGEDLFFPTIKDTVRECAFANLGESVRLETASFGQDAGVVGAASLALNAFFYRHPEGTI